MKIMLVARVWPMQRSGGMPFVTQDRAEELARRGHEVHVVTTSLNTTQNVIGKSYESVENGVIVHYTESPSQIWSPAFGEACKAAYRSLAPDVLHSDSYDRNHSWWWDLPMNITMHGFGFGAWLTKWNLYRAYGHRLPEMPLAELALEATTLVKAKMVLAVSRWERRMLVDQYGICQSKVLTVLNPISLDFFRPRSTDNRTYFLSVAVSQSATRGFQVAARAAKLARVPFVQVTGGESREKMVSLYDMAKALVLPTAFCQGFDLTVAEARARGTPAIMTQTGSYLDHKEVWDKLVGIGDIKGLAETMKDFKNIVPNDFISGYEHHPSSHVDCWLNVVY